MTHDIMDFIEYIHNEKQTSKNTEVSYERDLRRMYTGCLPLRRQI